MVLETNPMNTDIEACVDRDCTLNTLCHRYQVGVRQTIFHVGQWRMKEGGCDGFKELPPATDYSNAPVTRSFGLLH
jgi:hypothetical protein